MDEISIQINVDGKWHRKIAYVVEDENEDGILEVEYYTGRGPGKTRHKTSLFPTTQGGMCHQEKTLR